MEQLFEGGCMTIVRDTKLKVPMGCPDESMPWQLDLVSGVQRRSVF